MSIQPPYPRNVPLLKGALVSVGAGASQTVIPFQYNPESVRRQLKPNTVGADQGVRSQEVRFTGAPAETVSVEVQVDVIDQLGDGDADAAANGVYPQIRALELLAYPSSSQVEQYTTTLQSGGVSILPLVAPRLIFVWGPHRVIPVRIQSVTVTEEIFDNRLSPIRANLALEMHVLTYSDVFPDNPDYSLFLAHQKSMEQMARSAQATSLEGVAARASRGAVTPSGS